MLNDDSQVLVDLIDSLMANGSGHVNIISNESDKGLTVNVMNSTEYCLDKGACCQPTENAIDEQED